MKTIKTTQTKNTEAFQYLFSELNNIINENNNSNRLVTNCNIASFLQDSLLYDLKSSCISPELNQDFYKIGIFANLSLIVDRNQLWSDNIIYLKNNDETIETIEIIDDNYILE